MTRFARFLATGASALFVAMLGLAAPAHAGAVLASSHFDSDAEGWLAGYDAVDATKTTPTAATYESGVGSPAGSISATDSGSGVYWHFIAPAAFLGEKSAAYGGSLSFDLMQKDLRPGGSNNTTLPFVTLTGSGLTIGIAFGNAPSTTAFTSYDVALDTSADWKVLDSSGNATAVAATAVQIQSVLSSLTSLQIRGEYWSQLDKGYLDNVVMTAVPEPSSLVLAGLGLIPLGVARVRRRKRNGDGAAA